MVSKGLSTLMDLLPEGVSPGVVRVSRPTIPIPITLQGSFRQQASSLELGFASVSLQPDKISQAVIAFGFLTSK